MLWSQLYEFTGYPQDSPVQSWPWAATQVVRARNGGTGQGTTAVWGKRRGHNSILREPVILRKRKSPTRNVCVCSGLDMYAAHTFVHTEVPSCPVGNEPLSTSLEHCSPWLKRDSGCALTLIGRQLQPSAGRRAQLPEAHCLLTQLSVPPASPLILLRVLQCSSPAQMPEGLAGPPCPSEAASLC